MYVIMCFLLDFHLTCLMQPVPLVPIFAGYTVGILPEWFNISTHFSVLITMFITTAQLECLILCFEKKHQAIATALNVHVLPKSLEMFCYFLCSICPVTICFWFNSTHISKEDQWIYIETNLREYSEGFRSIQHFDVYTKTFSLVLLIKCVALGGVVFILLFLIFMVDIFKMMYQLKLRISKHNYEKHIEAIRTLTVQLATSSLCLGPPCILMIIVLSVVDQAQFLTELCIACITAHSSANTISLLIFFHPFRKFILTNLRW
ncbi:hypothetical protein CRE_06609 [Caenorhabditis remanei]|uniref:G-protein coupled receptors family 1 profile domain-containing protein n=1 Tax=Caenorhabditis remanei TaxID=31234 RepID=E3M1S1_CAERE|nr:hypothetical protein CRE_06609 [Caenorhabditis remanei]